MMSTSNYNKSESINKETDFDMAVGPEQRKVMMAEFESIVARAEAAISTNSSYISTQAWQEDQKRMTAIMTQVEGCGCQGRGTQLTAMFQSLARGRTGTLKAFAPIVFKSFWRDLTSTITKIL